MDKQRLDYKECKKQINRRNKNIVTVKHNNLHLLVIFLQHESDLVEWNCSYSFLKMYL